MADLTFYYDVVCPYAYLASTRVAALAERQGAEVRWVPILLGGLFRHVNGPQVPAAHMSAPRARLNLLDMQRWAARWGAPLTMPSAHPRRTVEAMRLLTAVEGATRVALTHALFAAYWVDGEDVADPAVLARLAAEHQVDASLADAPAARQALFDRTAEAAAAGAFGVPAFVVDGQLFWGQDRMHLVEQALRPRPKVRFFHDFSSPFSYLASTQVEAVCARHGADLEWAPILLGGLFRELGTPDVPLLAMNDAKRRYAARDLHDWAAHWGVPFKFPSRFPIRTVAPLRVALAEPATTACLYRAAWGEDRNIGDTGVLAEVLTEAGFDAAALLERTQDPAIKAQLFANTDRAQAFGACGAPTFVIDEKVVVWGQDRLDDVARYLRGELPPEGLHRA